MYQLPMALLLPEADWTPPNLNDLPQDWNLFTHIDIDLETRDDDLSRLGPGVRRGGYIVGTSIAWEGGPAHYLPIRHDGGGNLDAKQALAYIRHNAKSFRGTLVNANLPYDLDYLEEENITFPEVAWFRDVLVAEPLLDELQFSYSLESVAQRRLGAGKDESLLTQAAGAFATKQSKNPKSHLWKLHSRYVGPYATRDATLPLQLLRAQEAEIEKQGLRQAWDLESRIVPVVTAMRRRGIRIDQDALDKVEKWAAQEERDSLDLIKRETGVRIGFGHSMNTELGVQMLRSIGIEPGVSRTGKDSIRAEILESADHPAAKALRRARKMAKVRTTYVDSVREMMTHGRIHCTFNQLRATKEDGSEKGVITGRMSSDTPNLQNQPVRDEEIGPMWLSIYVPEESTQLALPDYSQAEPRWLVEWSIMAGPDRIGYTAWEAAKEFARRYREDPTMDFHVTTATLSEPGYSSYPKEKQKPVRQRYKSIGLGNIYGKGEVKLCRELGLPTEIKLLTSGPREGQRIEVAGPDGRIIFQNFHRGVPFAKEMLWADIKQAKEMGFVRTWSGRRGRFERDHDGNVIDPHKALNKRIQGSSADQTKMAMILLHEEKYFLQLQIHDSLGASVESIPQAQRMCSIMEHAIKMRVPMRADLKMGTSWGDAVSH